jgi:hypothetical protein
MGTSIMQQIVSSAFSTIFRQAQYLVAGLHSEQHDARAHSENLLSKSQAASTSASLVLVPEMSWS